MDGVEQGALRVIGHLQQFSERRDDFFEDVEVLIERRQEKHDEVARLEELIDEISSELQGIDVTTADGQSIGELEAERERKEEEKEGLLADKGGINEKTTTQQERVEQLEDEISQQRDEREETRLAQKRQRAAELAQAELVASFEELKDKVRSWSNQEVNDTALFRRVKSVI